MSLVQTSAGTTSVESASKAPVVIVDNGKDALDAFYLALEDRFRGTREEIKERLRIYLPWLEKHKIGGKAFPVVDLGCGRGEWLELLAESECHAYGVDTNRVFIADCV